MEIKLKEVNVYNIPLEEPLEAFAAGQMKSFDIILVKLTNSEGHEGYGYTITHQGQGNAVKAIIKNTLFKALDNEDPDKIEYLWYKMWKAHHYAGRGAPMSFSISAIDSALWDLKCKRLKIPLWNLLGGFRTSVKAYVGSIDLNFSKEKLVSNASKYIDDGYKAIKMRLGKQNIYEDIERIETMKNFLPKDVELMADANEAWRLDEALKASSLLKQYNLKWLEEPIQPDNYRGYKELRHITGIPIAAGENLHTLEEFNLLISNQGVDFPEPDFTTCGGITPFMKIAKLAESYNLPIISHGAHDLHISLLASIPNAAYIEIHAFAIDNLIEKELNVIDGYAQTSNRDGHGIVFKLDVMEKFKI